MDGTGSALAQLNMDQLLWGRVRRVRPGRVRRRAGKADRVR